MFLLVCAAYEVEIGLTLRCRSRSCIEFNIMWRLPKP